MNSFTHMCHALYCFCLEGPFPTLLISVPIFTRLVLMPPSLTPNISSEKPPDSHQVSACIPETPFIALIRFGQYISLAQLSTLSSIWTMIWYLFIGGLTFHGLAPNPSSAKQELPNRTRLARCCCPIGAAHSVPGCMDG